MESSRQNIRFYPLCIVLFFSIMLFSFLYTKEWIRWISFKNLHACGYPVLSSVETGCWPWISTNLEINRSAMNIFCSVDMRVARISLLLDSIAIHTQMYSGPTLITASSITYSEILFFFDGILWGWYFWIQFQIDTWFLWIKQKDSLSEVFS